MFILDLEKEGPTECKAMIVIMEQGKTNQFARKELGACIQNMHCAICPLGAVAFHFFTCWHLDLECHPSLATSQEWFNIKFTPGRRGPTKVITYNSHLKAMKQCLGSLRMSTAAKTHIGRGSGAQMAELGGSSEGDIRRLGRWNSQALVGCYLTSLPCPAQRTMAGFPPKIGYFHIKGVTIVPPEVLQGRLFTWVDHYSDDCEGWERTLAAQGFIRLLKYLRIVILQDAAVLIDANSNYPLFHHENFCSAEFLAFKEDLRVTMEGESPPIETRLQQAMPDMLTRVDGVRESLRADTQVVRDRVEQSLETANSIVSFIRDIISGRVPFFVSTGISTAVSESVTNEELVPAGAAPNVDESSWNAVVLPAVPVYKISRSLICVTDV